MRRVAGRKLVACVLGASLGVALVGASPAIAAAQTVNHTFAQVQCTAVVGGSTVSQKQDVTVSITAPDQVAPGQQFSVVFPTATNVLPKSSNGFTITSYSNLSLSYGIHGTTFDSGTIVNPGTATIDGNPTPETATLPTPDSIKLGQPGPFPPGTLVTPDISVSATAGAVGSSVTINALTLTTRAQLQPGNLTANVTCNIPQDTLITIPVVVANPPPTVDAGPDAAGTVNAPITLRGVVTDPYTSTTDTWTASNPACTFADPSSPATTVTCSQPGTFTATLTATDGVNAPVADTAQVTVAQTVPLTVNAGGPVSGTVSHPIVLAGSVSDPDHTPTVAWTIAGSGCAFANSADAATTVTCSAVGTYTATLTATDGVNPPASDTAQVTVDPDRPPVVSAGPDVSGDTGAPITLVGTASDPESDPLTMHWTASDPACTFGDASQLVTTITCSAQGSYTATLTVGDAFNPSVSDTATAVVSDVLLPFDWNVDATTHLKKLNMDVTIPTGNFTGVVDLTTGDLGGDITLPPAQVTLSLAGFGLVTANMQITETQPITGHLDPSTFQVSATAVFNIRIPSAYPSATPTVNIVGNSCTTSQPVSVTMNGIANLAGASTFSGLYTIPNLKTCGLATTALNLVIPGPGNTFSATVAPPPVAPSVTAQPSDTTVAPGQTYSFTAAGDGSPAPTVQWQVSTDGTTFTDIAGATDTTYSATAALADSGHQFRAVFTNATASATSNAATLTVAVAPDPPTIGTATAGTRRAGVAVAAPANDGGSPIIDYHASCTSGNGAPGTASGTSSPITVPGLTAGSTYTCVVSARNTIGASASSTASNPVVPTAPPAVTTQPSDSSVAAGQPYSFTAAATGVPAPTVQWQVSTDGTNFTDIAGATDTTVSGTATYAGAGDEFRAVFSNGVGTVTTNAATLFVTTPSSIAIAGAAVVEGDTGKPRSVTVAATLSQPSAQPVTVDYTTADGTAIAPDDYAAESGTLTFKAGKTTASVTLAVTPDTAVEPDETFHVILSNPSGGFSLDQHHSDAVVTILNDDTASGTHVSIGDAEICRPSSGNVTTAKIWVSLSAPATSTVTVDVTLSPGSASSGVDFKQWATKTLTFAPGQFQKAVSVAVIPTRASGADQTALLTLSNVSAGTAIARGVGTLTIHNP
jgi:hypothetical protein